MSAGVRPPFGTGTGSPPVPIRPAYMGCPVVGFGFGGGWRTAAGSTAVADSKAVEHRYGPAGLYGSGSRQRGPFYFGRSQGQSPSRRHPVCFGRPQVGLAERELAIIGADNESARKCGSMQILRVGYLALGLAPLAVPASAQERLRLFAPAPHSQPAPLQSAKAIPAMRAALTEAGCRSHCPRQKIRSSLTEARSLRSALDVQPQLRR